jgi:hypothetical protein
VQALGVVERLPVLCPLEVPGDACRALLLVRVELQGQVDRFFLLRTLADACPEDLCVVPDPAVVEIRSPSTALIDLNRKRLRTRGSASRRTGS